MQDTLAYINIVNFRCAVLEQAVGESTGRGAHICTHAPAHLHWKAARAASSFSPPRETKRGPRSTVTSASFGKFEAADLRPDRLHALVRHDQGLGLWRGFQPIHVRQAEVQANLRHEFIVTPGGKYHVK